MAHTLLQVLRLCSAFEDGPFDNRASVSGLPPTDRSTRTGARCSTLTADRGAHPLRMTHRITSSHHVTALALCSVLSFFPVFCCSEMPEVEVDYENQVKGYRYGQVRVRARRSVLSTLVVF